MCAGFHAPLHFANAHESRRRATARSARSTRAQAAGAGRQVVRPGDDAFAEQARTLVSPLGANQDGVGLTSQQWQRAAVGQPAVAEPCRHVPAGRAA